MVSDRTGLPEDKARVAAETVLGYLKSKLPPAVAGQLDAVAGGGSAGPNLGDMAGKMFGK